MNFRKSRARSRRNSTNLMTGNDKWRYAGKRISRKSSEDVEEDEEEYDFNFGLGTDWAEEFFGTKDNDNEKEEDQDVEVYLTRKQTLILATLVPDEILLLDQFSGTEPKRFVGVLLMADVSGYTSLSERYHNTGKGGTYRLTATLNTYLGSLIELIYGHGGDVLKFAGDAFLALWKADKRVFLCHTIHTAIACALMIQHSYGVYETDVKVNLKVKLAISAGSLLFAPIGTENDLNFVIVGLPVFEAKITESTCQSGEVNISPSAWGHCYSRNYEHVAHPDGHVTLKSILYDPRDLDVCKPFHGFGSAARQQRKVFTAIEDLPDLTWRTSMALEDIEIAKREETLYMRKAILQAEIRVIGADVRKFMIRPVLQQVDAHQPLEYLTEMRQVTVMFLTLKPTDCPYLQLITIVNKAYQITCQMVYKSMGCVNKIILFDKDVMILVIFGLRGFKHESEAQIALKCAYSVKKSIAALDGVIEVSVGVTTGQVYCGVVGHPLRREFTVIGAVVNKAARIMCAFRDKVTCDEVTFIKSKMSTNSFIIQPKITLKGIVDAGKIYEYTEEIRVKQLYDIDMVLPLLDRYDEVEYFRNWLDSNHPSYRNFEALLIIGESRIGKSRLLEYMGRYAQNNGYHVCTVMLTSIHSATAYLAVNQIMNQLLCLPEQGPGFAREEAIVQTLHGYNDDLCYLNNILRVRFAYHEGLYTQTDQHRKIKTKAIFKQLLMNVIKPVLICLDDLQNLDASSWELISIMVNMKTLFIVMTLTRARFGSVNDWLYEVIIDQNIRKIGIGPLGADCIAPLACQILDVTAVPSDLCQALKIKCRGNPGLVETFLVHLFSSGALTIAHCDPASISEEDMVFPDKKFIKPLAVNENEQETLEMLCQNEQQDQPAICLVNIKEELKTSINVQNIDALIMTQIDSLTPYQQLLLKIASVIGDVFSRDLLESIMYENNDITTAKAIKRLFAMRLLSCANNHSKFRRSIRSFTSTSASFTISCDCNFDYDPEDHENLPKYAYCKLLRFKNKVSRLACYELLPMNQKKEFHSRIVNYLQSDTQKCPSCGGSIMVAQSFMTLENNNFDGSTMACKRNKRNRNSNYTSLSFDDSTSDEVEQEVCKVKSEISPESEGSYVSDLRKIKSESVGGQDNKSSIISRIEDINVTTIQDLNISEKQLVEKKSSSLLMPILKGRIGDRSRTTSTDIENDDRRLNKRVTMQGSDIIRIANDLDSSSSASLGPKILDMFREITEADKIKDWHDLGIVDSDEEKALEERVECKEKRSFSVRVEKGVSQINFDNCTCTELAICIYDQLIHHATQADLKIKAIEFLIKYSALCITGNNLDNAIDKLNEAEERCKDKDMMNDKATAFEKQRFLGKIYTLRAAACIAMGNLFAARVEVDYATKIYGISINSMPIAHELSGIGRNIIELLKSRRKMRGKAAILTSDSLSCLNVATVLYAALGEERLARNTALRALNILRKVKSDAVDACDAHSNAIHVELDRGRPEATEPIERSACETLRGLVNPVRADQLRAIGKLFAATFRARIARGRLPPAIRAGFRSIVVGRLVHADNVAVEIIPELFYLLIARRRIPEAVDLVSDLLRMAERRASLECETWYFALCLDMILDAGFQIEPMRAIVNFADCTPERGLKSGGARRRLAVGMWTYHLRCGMDRRAKRWEEEALFWAAREIDEGSFAVLFSSLRLAEGMMASLTRKVDDLRKVVDMMQLRSLAERELNSLENGTRICRTAIPRWLLLRAECSALSGRHAAAVASRAQAADEAARMSNRLEMAAARAAANTTSASAWLSYARAGDFPDWRTGAARARNSWHNFIFRPSVTQK